ncbi:GNAT family N-acetyltransferase [Temperatibacter marinus]|uniref:GNAT family N-acetyltransferase n=1 Tax=Temperatibacter marinus TaxID=1456591 RepID=A0AA52EJW3_9PROT|nr:GNAT family N-acetyltransferase [Temperatibacter marinus]WND04150.1 GNAT family N-acetyltransferase [Temperatibacter marinus]
MTRLKARISLFPVLKDNLQALTLLAQLHKKIFGPHRERIWSVNDFSALAILPTSALNIVYVGEEPIGLVTFSCVAGEAELLSLGLEVAYEGQGLAGEVMHLLRRYLKDNGIQDLYLEVRENNERAINFYEGHGFYQTGLRRNYYTLTDGTKVHAVTMALKIV